MSTQMTDSPYTPTFGLNQDAIERLPLTNEHDDVEDDLEDLLPRQRRRSRLGMGKARRIWDNARSLYHDNVGLLLIILSQLFFAFMNLFVKLLTGLENPVDALQVRYLLYFHP